MIKLFSILLILFLPTLDLYGQSTSVKKNDGLTIDPGIKAVAELYIEKSEPHEGIAEWLMYNSQMIVDFYLGDTLIISTRDKEIKRASKSFYYWRNDTLTIDGAFGLFGGFGFTIKIVNGHATLYHLLASDEFPSYAYNENDRLIPRLEVPCTETKIILSELPDPKKKQLIYGYVEFKSSNFYSSNGSIDGKEIKPRNKNRNNMKMYFKSGITPF